MEQQIKALVHQYYWEQDLNCAKTTLLCLGALLDSPVTPQTLDAAAGMHGAGGFRAQCGLVEGALMFIGVYFAQKGVDDSGIARLCYDFAEAFTHRFSSLSCFDLRPGGFSKDDPPHRCEQLTSDAIHFAYAFIKDRQAR